MKRFIKKIGLYCGILLAIGHILLLVHIGVLGNQFEQSYNASIVDKVNRLKDINKPKIILVGNSNVSFGFDSEEILKATEMPVVNLGLHGGLGNRFHEDLAKFNVKNGDIVVICHSSYSDNGKIPDYSLAWATIEWHEQLWALIHEDEYMAMAQTYPQFFAKAFARWMRGEIGRNDSAPYSRNAFNEYGDVVNKPIEKSFEDEDIFFRQNVLKPPDINESCINRLNNLNEYVKGKGGHMVVAGYPIAYGRHSQFDVSDIKAFEKELRMKLNCPVISSYEDYLMPYSMFYDTTLHLNEMGVRNRTKLFINDLKGWDGITR